MGPLAGFRIVEIAGIGPGQLTGMLLADMGAQIIRIGRHNTGDLGIDMPAKYNLMNRSRPTIAVDLKSPDGIELVLSVTDKADALFEGFRPGVMERLGLGPDVCLARNARLVYGRMTGWGQTGPLAEAAGHDTNYIALAGVLRSIGDADRPPPLPLNLIGDFGGGGLYLAMGLLAGMLEAARSGQGQVVDATMLDGAASMMTMFYGLMAGGAWSDKRGSNVLDGGAPFARAYATSDGEYVSVCTIERRFFKELVERTGVDIDPGEQMDTAKWPAHGRKFREMFVTRTRAEWCEILEGTDACFAPALSLTAATTHPHNVSRGTYVDVDGIVQPGPAPRFSRTQSEISCGPKEPGTDVEAVLADWGVPDAKVSRLIDTNVVGTAK